MEIFLSLNRLYDSVSEAEYHDIKILIRFPGNPILEISMKNLNRVGSKYAWALIHKTMSHSYL